MGFDANNIGTYKFTAFGIQLASIIVSVKMVYSNWGAIGMSTLASVFSLLIAFLIAFQVGRFWRPSAVIALAMFFVVIGVYGKHLSPALAHIILSLCVLIITGNIVMGDKFDVDTPKRTIRIKIPRFW